MRDLLIHQQKHGYRNGHQLLEGTIRLDRSDQETIDRLSDLSGPIRPSEVVPAYLTIYPLPSRTFHVVARTWPDLDAPRAGCVLTRSLLVPTQLWNDNAYLPWLLERLTLSSASELQPIEYHPVQEPIQPIADPRTLELIESLFLEARKPIAVLDAKDADLIATRLLTAFWPSFRSEFSVCTHALGPRKIGGRDFDLVFAPKNARSRFSAWAGRKIDGGAPRSARHRWSQAVADAVFLSPNPTLAAGDALGLLGVDGPGDEAAFRKSLLWNELAEKAPHNPNAVLGMLDIVNSQSGLAPNAMKGSQKLLTSAIGSVVRNMTPTDAWNFLSALESKIHGRGDLVVLRKEARLDAARLASSHPDLAVEFAADYKNESELQSDLLRGLADGLGNVTDVAEVDTQRIPPLIGSYMIANSSSFAAMIGRRIRTGMTPASELMAYFQREADPWREQASGRLVNEVDSAEFAPLLKGLLNAAPEDQIAERIVAIARQTALRFSELDEALVDAIPNETALQTVRSTIAQEVQHREGDRFLAKTMRLTRADFDWITGSSIEPTRAGKILLIALEGCSDRVLKNALANSFVISTVMNILLREKANSVGQLARVMVLGPVEAEDLFEHGPLLIDALPEGQLRRNLVRLFVERALLEGNALSDRVEALIAHHLDEIGPRQLLKWCTADGLTTVQVATNLEVLVRFPEQRRRQVADFIENLSDDLLRRGPRGLDTRLCSAWAHLLWEASFLSPLAHLRAATKSLTALMHETRLPVAEVVAASFPFVYEGLVSRKKADSDGIFGLLFSLPLMLVSDWDRAKPARHGLVDAFMSSNWQPAYLLLAGSRAGILDRICLRVSRQRGGEKYLKKAIADLDRLGEKQEASIRSALAEFDMVDMRNEWD